MGTIQFDWRTERVTVDCPLFSYSCVTGRPAFGQSRSAQLVDLIVCLNYTISHRRGGPQKKKKKQLQLIARQPIINRFQPGECKKTHGTVIGNGLDQKTRLELVVDVD